MRKRPIETCEESGWNETKVPSKRGKRRPRKIWRLTLRYKMRYKQDQENFGG